MRFTMPVREESWKPDWRGCLNTFPPQAREETLLFFTEAATVVIYEKEKYWLSDFDQPSWCLQEREEDLVPTDAIK